MSAGVLPNKNASFVAMKIAQLVCGAVFGDIVSRC